MKPVVLLGLLSFLGGPVLADVDVRIVDYPTIEVLRYSPIFITARVTNHGSAPVLIPATNYTSSRYFVETGRKPEELTELEPYQSTGGGNVIWLKPGEAWFFRTDLGPWSQDTGSYFVRVGLQSTGKCEHHATGKETLPLKAVHKSPGLELYECWSGRATSDVVKFDVVEPRSAVDSAALEYVRSPDFPVTWHARDRLDLRLQAGVFSLFERFPTSHYTYVAAFYGCNRSPACLDRILGLQPSHPLTPYTRLQRALALIESGHAQDVTPASIRQMDLPAALKEYLLQEEAASPVAADAPAQSSRRE